MTQARPWRKHTGSGVGWGHQLGPALSAIGMHSRLVCQLLANGHLTAAMSHNATVTTRTPLKYNEEEIHATHVNNDMQQMNNDLKKGFLSSVKGRGEATASDLSCCTHLLLLALLLKRHSDCNNVKKQGGADSL